MDCKSRNTPYQLSSNWTSSRLGHKKSYGILYQGYRCGADEETSCNLSSKIRRYEFSTGLKANKHEYTFLPYIVFISHFKHDCKSCFWYSDTFLRITLVPFWNGLTYSHMLLWCYNGIFSFLETHPTTAYLNILNERLSLF